MFSTVGKNIIWQDYMLEHCFLNNQILQNVKNCTAREYPKMKFQRFLIVFIKRPDRKKRKTVSELALIFQRK